MCEEEYQPCFWFEVDENGTDSDDDADEGHVQTPCSYQNLYQTKFSIHN